VIVRWLAAAVATALLGVAALVGAAPASAHAVRISTDPAADASLTQGPPKVSAVFNEQLQTSFAAMTVVGPDHNLWSSDSAQISGPTASVNLRPLGPTGTYTVNYRVTSADGHVVSGSWSFQLTVAGTGTPGPPVTAGGEDDALPVWPFIVAAAVIVGAGAVWAARRRT
jgi:copper resistance protein C